MTSTSGLMAAVGGLLVLGTPVPSNAQPASRSVGPSVARIAAIAPGSINGIVRDETGIPVAGAMVSAVGTTTVVAVTDRNGRFDLEALSPGPYLLRAHLTGYIAPRAVVVEVRSSGRTVSTIALRRAGTTTVLAAGVGVVSREPADPVQPLEQPAVSSDDDHSERVWRLRHARRGILKEITALDLWAVNKGAFERAAALGTAIGSPVRLATSFLGDIPFSGHVNLLTTGSLETPRHLFSSDNLSRGIAYIKLGAPAGGRADWTLRGALSQADLSSWILAGSYTTKMPARHKYDLGISYSTQRYDGGNPLALRAVTDGSRNAGAVHLFDTVAITPALEVTYGGRYARYDYLDNRNLLGGRVEVTLTPAERLRISGELSRRAHAPGAEEFLPPAQDGIWLPPQRTFSPITAERRFEAEHTTHLGVAVERDLAGSTVSFAAFRQSVEDQLVAVFGADPAGGPSAAVGHYFVGNAGTVDAVGYRTSFRTTLARGVHGRLAYTLASAELAPADGLRYLVLMVPSAAQRSRERIHDVSTTIEANVPETATRVLVLYRVGNAFARPGLGRDASDGAGLDSRFDLQVRQSLPFLDFTSAKWEMLVAVRNFFRETVDHQSIYDELLVVNPPKRLVGGVTMRF